MTATIFRFPPKSHGPGIINPAATVAAWPRHHRARCAPGCDGCCLCEGGLFCCTVCGGAEGSLPTDCPGRRMSNMVCDLVYSDKLDYRRRDGWHQPRGRKVPIG